MTSNASSSNRRPYALGLLLGVLLSTLFYAGSCQAQELAVDSTPTAAVDTATLTRLVNERYAARVRKAHERWMRLIPNLSVVQYAGDIGMLSAGIGWDYGKNRRWETLLLLGYLPKFHTDENDLTFTLKENLIPWSISCPRSFSIQPAVFTLFVNSVFDDAYWTREPDRYPSGYYGFSSRIRTSIGFGGRISFDIPDTHQPHSDRVSLYYELSSCDLYIISAVPNRRLTFGDILRLGLGIQYRFF
jgi:hypothetical protein